MNSNISSFYKLGCLFTMLSFVYAIDCQTPVYDFSFSDCTADDQQMSGIVPSIITGSPNCVCGPIDNALSFDGTNDYIELDSTVKDIFKSDFTMSLYFWVEDSNSPYNIFSVVKSSCVDRDSTMTIRYIPVSGILEVDFIKNLGDRLSMNMPLDENVCWHHLVLTKSGTSYSVYLNERFIETLDFNTSYEQSDTSAVFIGYSSCISTSDDLFRGRIDALQFYDQAFTLTEQSFLNISPDQILTENTTLFEGDGVQVLTGGTCTSNFSWTPTTGLDNPTALEPFITPTESTVYALNIDHGTCSVVDSLTLNVITDEELDCDELLLPKAFSPNGDNLNDTYGISNTFIIEELEYFRIFDRWGSLIFETDTVDAGWDGSYRGIPMNPATFVYKAKYTCLGNEKLAVGSFTILR